MSEQSNVSLKFGTGDAPWYTVYGSPAEIRAQLVEAFDLPEYWLGQSLDRVIIEASRWARGLYLTVAKLTDEPKVTVWALDENGEKVAPVRGTESVPAEPEPKPTRNTKGGLAAQAKAAKSSEPEENTTDIPELIANAITKDALHDIFNKFENGWKPEYNELAAARVAEINGEAA